jgi:uncharacterized protein YdaU (DUF1376 family)
VIGAESNGLNNGAREVMSKAWMPLYIGDYLRKTRHLSLAEHGAYLLLIMHYWDNGPLPNDDAKLAHILGVPLRRFRSLSVPVRSYFTEANAKQLLRHNRLDEELEKADIISQKRALAGAKGGWHSRGKTNQERNHWKAFAKQTGDQSQSHSKLSSLYAAAHVERKRSFEEEG